MSSTNRGTARERDDFYETPAWATEALLRQVLSMWRPPLTVLDPFAGRGAILDVCARAGMRTLGIEIDVARASQCTTGGHDCTPGDAFTFVPRGFDAIITNPPFSVAQKAAEWCLEHAKGRPVAMLLRLAFLESMERVAFHKRHPANIHVLPRRPSFLTKEQKARIHAEAIARWEADGKRGQRPSPPSTDSCAYGWFVWWPHMETAGQWSVLDVAKEAKP